MADTQAVAGPLVGDKSQANGIGHLETKVFTVPQDRVNLEIEARQLFGWSVVNTSARSFATRASTIGTAQAIGNTGIGAANTSIASQHMTDLTLQRDSSRVTTAQRDLEAEWEAISVNISQGPLLLSVLGMVVGLPMLVFGQFVIGGLVIAASAVGLVVSFQAKRKVIQEANDARQDILAKGKQLPRPPQQTRPAVSPSATAAFCSSCGRQLSPQAAFCAACGMAVDRPVSA